MTRNTYFRNHNQLQQQQNRRLAEMFGRKFRSEKKNRTNRKEKNRVLSQDDPNFAEFLAFRSFS